MDDQYDDPVPLSLDSVYDLSFDNENNVVMFHDIKSDVYYGMPHQRFEAFVRTTYGDKREQILNAVYSFKNMRVIPGDRIAAVKPPASNDYEAIVLDTMFESAGVEFKTAEERRDYYIDKYRIKLT